MKGLHMIAIKKRYLAQIIKVFLVSLLSVSYAFTRQASTSTTTNNTISVINAMPSSNTLPVINTIPAAKSMQGSSSSIKLSLDQIYALSLKKRTESVPTRSQAINPAQKTTDLFTQSQAHMSVPEVKKLIDKTYDIKPYQNLINQIVATEKKYADYYVFYHGLDNVWRLAQDVYTRLYANFNNIAAENIKDFVFLRFNGLDNLAAIDTILAGTMKKSGLINDHTMGDDIIAVNLALFGNVDTDPECTWQYFIKTRGHTKPSRQIYEKMMNKFGLTDKYIDELMGLTKLYEAKQEMIAQIFIPKDTVDSIGYLAWIRGIPAYQDFMNTVLRSVQDKKFSKTAPALDYYTTLFKQEQDKNQLFKNMIERVEKGEFALSYFLTFYRNQPNQIEDINSFQARLFLTHDIMLNPFSGVKIFRYSMSNQDQLKRYHEKLDEIIKKIIAEKI